MKHEEGKTYGYLYVEREGLVGFSGLERNVILRSPLVGGASLKPESFSQLILYK